MGAIILLVAIIAAVFIFLAFAVHGHLSNPNRALKKASDEALRAANIERSRALRQLNIARRGLNRIASGIAGLPEVEAQAVLDEIDASEPKELNG